MRTPKTSTVTAAKKPFKERFLRDMKKNYSLYLLILPVIAFYVIVHYVPMYGAIIAFKNYSPAKGILGSAWCGLKNFKEFFGSVYFSRTLIFENSSDGYISAALYIARGYMRFALGLLRDGRRNNGYMR